MEGWVHPPDILYLCNALLEGRPRELTGPLHGLTVVVRPPGGTEDVNDVEGVREGLGLQSVCYSPVQHPNT